MRRVYPELWASSLRRVCDLDDRAVGLEHLEALVTAAGDRRRCVVDRAVLLEEREVGLVDVVEEMSGRSLERRRAHERVVLDLRGLALDRVQVHAEQLRQRLLLRSGRRGRVRDGGRRVTAAAGDQHGKEEQETPTHPPGTLAKSSYRCSGHSPGTLPSPR